MLQLRTLTLQVAEIYSHVGSAKPAADWATFWQIQASMIIFTQYHAFRKRGKLRRFLSWSASSLSCRISECTCQACKSAGSQIFIAHTQFATS